MPSTPFASRFLALSASILLFAAMEMLAAETNWTITPQYEQTLQMISAHEALRQAEVADADAPANRLALEIMVKKSLLRGGYTPPSIDPGEIPQIDTAVTASLKSSFSVDNKGRGNLSISLPTPDSRATPEPSLSLSYSSQSSSGILGKGFALFHGFHSSILRGRSIHARDGEPRLIEMDASDKFYLSGKRLICITGPDDYGKPGSQYRTEVDGFYRITAHGNGNQTDSFTLLDKYGRLYTFGAIDDQRDGCHRGFLETENRLDSVVYSFAIKRVEDQLGNFVTFDYEHAGFGEWLLKSIRYTGFKEQAPLWEIKLGYRQSTARKPTYNWLRRFDESHILESISITHIPENVVVSTFDFIYLPLGPDQVERLIEIRSHLRSDLSSPLQEIAPTRLLWSDGYDWQSEFVELPTPTRKLPQSYRQVFEDFNGDGKADRLLVTDKVLVALSNAQGFGDRLTPWLPSSEIASLGDSTPLELTTLDFNADGMTDLLLSKANRPAFLYVSTGSDFRRLATIQRSDHRTTTFLCGDVNADGRDDIIESLADSSLRLHASLGASLAPPVDIGKHRDGEDGAITHASHAVDLNQDALADYLWIESNPHAAYEPIRLRYRLSLPESSYSAPVTLFETNATIEHLFVLSGDFNGDDKTDFLCGLQDPQDPATLSWTLITLRGHTANLTDPTAEQLASLFTARPITLANARFTPTSGNPSWPIQNSLTSESRLNLTAIDLNQDGCDDLAWFEEGDAAGWRVALSRGDGSFFETQTPPRTDPFWNVTTPASYSQVTRSLLYRDIDGDGLRDMLSLASRQGIDNQLQTARLGLPKAPSSSHLPNLITTVIDGYGKITCAAYKAAKDDRAYTPGAPASYPIKEIRSSLPVVTDIWRDLGADRFSQFSYQYSGNRTDLSGRGTLGFASFTTIDRHTGFLSYQHVAHSFPMTGLVTREEVYRTWKSGRKAHIKIVSLEDNAVSYDAVVDPFSGTYLGTVHPFTSTESIRKWDSNLETHFTIPLPELNDFSPKTVSFRKPLSLSPRYRTLTTHWLDEQDPTRPPPAEAANIQVPHPLDPQKPGAIIRLPGQISFGNEKKTTVDYGHNRIEKEQSSFQAVPRYDAPFTSLKTSFRSQKLPNISSEQSTPHTTYEFFPNTTYWSIRKVYPQDWNFGSSQAGAVETHYERDERGNTTHQFTRTYSSDSHTDTSTYKGSDFYPDIDQPRTTSYEDGELRWSQYNPIFREASSTEYERGITVTTLFDPMGRKTRVSNVSYKYLRETLYVWTPEDGEAWLRSQIVRPPQGVKGIENRSRYAERIDKKGDPSVITYFDRTGRAIRVVEINKETITYQDTVFDEKGYETAVSKPYEPGMPSAWTIKDYDAYGRVEQEVEKTFSNP